MELSLSLSVCVCVCVCAWLSALRRVVNVKVALELMQIKKRWLIPFDPPLFAALMRPFAWRY